MVDKYSDIAQMMDKKVVDDYMSTWSDEKKASYEAMLEQCTTAEEKANVMKQYKYRDAYNYLSSQADLAIMGGQYLDAEGKYVWSEGLDNQISSYDNTIEKANGELAKINYGKKSLFEENQYADLGHLEDVVDKNGRVKDAGVVTKGNNAREGNMDDLAGVYDEAKEKLIAARDEQTSIKDAATADKERCEAARKIENAKLAFSQAMLTGNEEMINASAKIWMQSEIDYYDKYESNNSIDTPEEGARALEINQFKTALGISDNSYTSETQAQTQTQTETQQTEEKTETDASDTTSSSSDTQTEETAETSATETETQTQTETVESTVETADVKAGAEETTEQMSDKPNPYAFEKPPQPQGMPNASYETMCKDMEAAHIKEVNAKVADEIWNEGKWGNGQERIDKLTAAGYDVAGVQAAVNEKIAKINETSAAKTVEAQAITAEKTETQTSVKSDSPETKTWTDDKGNKITDTYIGDKKLRTMECTDGKTWDIVYGEDGKRDAATCKDPKTGKVTNITYNEEGYKDVVQVSIDGKPVKDIKYDGTADERKVIEAKFDTKNDIIQEIKYDKDGKVISEEIIDPTDRPGMDGQAWDEEDGSASSQTWEEANATSGQTWEEATGKTKESDAKVEKDDEKNIITKSWTDEKGNKITEVYPNIYKDIDEPLAARYVESPTGEKWETMFDGNGDKTSERYTDPETDTSKLTRWQNGNLKSVETFDKNGKAISGTIYDGTPDKKKRYEYKIEDNTYKRTDYDASGKKSRYTEAEVGEDGHLGDITKEVKFDKDGKPIKNSRRELNPEKKEQPPLKKKKKTKGVNSYLEEGEVDEFDATVDVPAFDPTVDVPAFDPKVDVPAFDPKVDEPKFDPKVNEPTFDDKIDEPAFDPTVDEGTTKKETKKKAKSSRFDTAASMADDIGGKGKNTDYGMGPDAD